MANSPTPAWRWGVVWFFFAATLLNYADRLALGSTQRYLLPEFASTPEGQKQVYATVNAAFGFAFGLGQLLAGFLVDRLSLRRLYAVAILVWSAAGVATGLVPAGAILGLIACRRLLGVGEAFNWPAAVAGIRRLIPRESRGLANGIFHGGATLGAILTPLLVLATVDKQTGDGWRDVFVVIGSAGVVWAILWMIYTRSPRADIIDAVPTPDVNADTQTERDPTLLQVVTGPLFWICLTVGCGVNLAWHLTNTWFPLHLEKDLHIAAGTDLYLYAGFFVAADLGSVTAGWAARSLARAGWQVGRARQLVMTTLACLSAIGGFTLAATPTDAILVKMLAFALMAASIVGGFSVVFALMQDASARHTAQVVGLCGCAAWMLISLTNAQIAGLPGDGVPLWLFPLAGCMPMVAAIAIWCWPVNRTG